jgi:FkbM family methyltransferase
MSRYFGLNDLDKKLEQYLPEKNGFFVELGANNGVDQSNTLYFERYKGWKGVLVEPVVHNYFKCRENRSKDNRIFCNACVSFGYKHKFVPIAYANLMTTALIATSDIRDKYGHLKNGRQFLKQNEDVVIFGALAKTLHEILVESDAPECIDLLSLDVEGAELEVIQGVDLTKFSFRYMCIECRDIDRLRSYLQEHGYALVERLSEHDYLFRPNSPV